eukprot:519637_1
MSELHQHELDQYKLYEKLLSMGFDDNLSFEAARTFHSCANKAVQYILTQQKRSDSNFKSEQKCQVSNQPEQKTNLDKYDEQETIVHNNDLRIPIYESKHRDKNIIKCIGELVCSYVYNQYNYRISTIGTGTVFHVKKNRAFLLTAAHNIRHQIYCCSQCNVVTEEPCIHNTDFIMLKASTIKFKRRLTQKQILEFKSDGLIENKIFGDMEQVYECRIERIDDLQYQQYPSPISGHDWTILSFSDHDHYYTDKTGNIQIRNDIQTLLKYHSFNIFGYPSDYKHQMYGMEANNNEFKIKTYPSTQKQYLLQRSVDTVSGQSGSAVWVNTNNDITVIVGIHSGGNKVKKCNYATLIDTDILHCIDQITYTPLYTTSAQPMNIKCRLIKQLTQTASMKCQQMQNIIGHAVMIIYLDTPSNENDLVVSIEMRTVEGNAIFRGTTKVYIIEQMFGNFNSFVKSQERVIKKVSFAQIEDFCKKYSEKYSNYSLVFNNCRMFMNALTKYIGVDYDIGLW